MASHRYNKRYSDGAREERGDRRAQQQRSQRSLTLGSFPAASDPSNDVTMCCTLCQKSLRTDREVQVHLASSMHLNMVVRHPMLMMHDILVPGQNLDATRNEMYAVEQSMDPSGSLLDSQVVSMSQPDFSADSNSGDFRELLSRKSRDSRDHDFRELLNSSRQQRDEDIRSARQLEDRQMIEDLERKTRLVEGIARLQRESESQGSWEPAASSKPQSTMFSEDNWEYVDNSREVLERFDQRRNYLSFTEDGSASDVALRNTDWHERTDERQSGLFAHPVGFLTDEERAAAVEQNRRRGRERHREEEEARQKEDIRRSEMRQREEERFRQEQEKRREAAKHREEEEERLRQEHEERLRREEEERLRREEEERLRREEEERLREREEEIASLKKAERQEANKISELFKTLDELKTGRLSREKKWKEENEDIQKEKEKLREKMKEEEEEAAVRRRDLEEKQKKLDNEFISKQEEVMLQWKTILEKTEESQAMEIKQRQQQQQQQQQQQKPSYNVQDQQRQSAGPSRETDRRSGIPIRHGTSFSSFSDSKETASPDGTAGMASQVGSRTGRKVVKVKRIKKRSDEEFTDSVAPPSTKRATSAGGEGKIPEHSSVKSAQKSPLLISTKIDKLAASLSVFVSSFGQVEPANRNNQKPRFDEDEETDFFIDVSGSTNDGFAEERLEATRRIEAGTKGRMGQLQIPGLDLYEGGDIRVKGNAEGRDGELQEGGARRSTAGSGTGDLAPTGGRKVVDKRLPFESFSIADDRKEKEEEERGRRQSGRGRGYGYEDDRRQTNQGTAQEEFPSSQWTMGGPHDAQRQDERRQGGGREGYSSANVQQSPQWFGKSPVRGGTGRRGTGPALSTPKHHQNQTEFRSEYW